MSKIKGSISVDVIDKQTVDLEIEILRSRLAYAITQRLDGYYISDEQPYLETDDNSASVEVTLYGVDDHIDNNDIDWLELIDDTIQVLAKNKLSLVNTVNKDGDTESSSK